VCDQMAFIGKKAISRRILRANGYLVELCLA